MFKNALEEMKAESLTLLFCTPEEGHHQDFPILNAGKYGFLLFIVIFPLPSLRI
jgi:hypothetical protein